MKKLIGIFQVIFLSLILVLASFGGIKTKAAENDKYYENNYFTISYKNDEVKVLINSNLKEFKNFRGADLTELKNNLVSVIYSAIVSDMDFDTVASGTTSSASLPSGSIDMSLLGGIIDNNLNSLDDVDKVINGDDYDTLLEFYIDRYVDNYVSTNGGTVNDALAEVQDQLTTKIQDSARDVYSDVNGEDLSSETPNDAIEEKISNIVNSVKTNKENSTEISVDLSEVKDIINLIDDKTTVVDVVKELAVEDEIKDIIKNSTADETLDFISNVDMDTIIEVYKNVNITKDEVKDIITNVGSDNLIEIVDKVGIDDVKKLASEMGLSKDELKEIITDSVSDISIGSLIKTLKSLSLDGNKIYENEQIVASGIKAVIAGLPGFEEIANYSDDEMNLSWVIKAETLLGDVEFKLTVGFKGDCSYIRSIAQKLADAIDINVNNGVYNITINAPQKFTNLLLKLAETETISDSIKHDLFNDLFASVDELYASIRNKSLEEYIEILKQFDYKTILANLYNAEKLNSVLGISSLTDDKLDAFVDEVFALVKKASGYTYNDIKALVGKYFDISSLDGTIVEKVINKVIDVLKEIDSLSIDSKLLREFIDPNSSYTNQSVYSRIEQLANHEGYYDKAMSYLDSIYSKLPERVKDNSILDFYLGNGVINYSGNIPLDFERVLNTISSQYGQKVYDAMKIIFDKLPENVNVSLTLNLKGVYKVTYCYGDKEVEGLLPAGADVSFFANVDTIDGVPIAKWVDNEGTEYTEMPEHDVKLYAYSAYTASIESGVTKEYDGNKFVLKVKTNPENAYSYQWYKNGQKVEGATSSTLNVINVKDSGTYYCVVTLGGATLQTNSVEVVITKATLSAASLHWNYSTPFTYTGSTYTVKLAGNLAGASITYSGNSAKNAGTYVAKAIISYDSDNYNLVNAVSELTWTINKGSIYVGSIEWNYSSPLAYSGSEYSVELKECPKNVSVKYTGNKGTEVGVYIAKAEFVYDSINYDLIGTVKDLVWEIAKQKVDASKFEWTYANPFTFDGNEKEVVLKNKVNGITFKYEGNKATNAGEYVAKVTLEYDPELVEVTGTVSDLTWEISKAKIDLAKVKWNYSSAFTYDGKVKEVSLVNVPSLVSVKYENASNVNAGKYAAKATFVYDEANYELVGSVSDLSWEISKAKIDVTKVSWDYSQAFKYDGKEKTVSLKNVPDLVKVTYEAASATKVGKYIAKANLEVNENYELVGNATLSLNWEISEGDTKNNFEAKLGDDVVVIVTSKDGISASYSISLVEVSDKDVDLSGVLGKKEEGKLVKTYEIKFVDEDGKEVKLDGSFTVKLLIPAEYKDSKNLKVVYIDENGNATEMTSSLSGEYIVFETTHFSLYAIVEVNKASSNAWVIWLIIGLIVLAAIPAAYIIIKKYNK